MKTSHHSVNLAALPDSNVISQNFLDDVYRQYFHNLSPLVRIDKVTGSRLKVGSKHGGNMHKRMWLGEESSVQFFCRYINYQRYDTAYWFEGGLIGEGRSPHEQTSTDSWTDRDTGQGCYYRHQVSFWTVHASRKKLRIVNAHET